MKYEVVMSLRPKWAAAILAGTKTLEVRTSGPDRREMKQSGPITVWIYETKTDGGRGMVVGKFLCREVCRERIPPRDARRAEEVERRTQLIMPDLERYRGGRKRLCLWEVEQPEAVEPFPIQRLGIHCPPVSWCRAGRMRAK